jgi:putative ABC transport system ATP-binding protein
VADADCVIRMERVEKVYRTGELVFHALRGITLDIRAGEFVFQGFNLLARTSALENVELPLAYRGLGSKERRRRAIESLALVGLADKLDNTPAQLSGGQQQRVAIARALVTEPKVLLADEPTGNLDSRTTEDVLALMQRLHREHGLTIVMVTHEPDVAQCAERIIVVRDGLIGSDGPNPTPRRAELNTGSTSPLLAGGG